MILIDDFVPAFDAEFRKWSYGKVATIDDLYNPRIFGPSKDGLCECGAVKLLTEETEPFCDKCGVIAVINSAEARATRMGHLDLPCSIEHPFEKSTELTVVPIAPLDLRVDKNTPIPLGRLYEELVSTCNRFSNVGLINTSRFRHIGEIWSEILGGCDDVLGTSLASYIADSLLRRVPPRNVIFRSMGLALRLELENWG